MWMYGSVKKNATNVAWQHLKKCPKMLRFLPPKASHFDGRAAVHRLVKRHNPWIAAYFCWITFCRENVVRSPNCGTFGKNCGTFGKKRRNSVSQSLLGTNHKSAVRKSGPLLIKIVVFFFMHIVQVPVPLSQIRALDKELKDHQQRKPTGKSAKHGQLEVIYTEWLVSTNV